MAAAIKRMSAAPRTRLRFASADQKGSACLGKQPGDLGVGMAGAKGTTPVLRKMRHAQIVTGHGLINMQDLPAFTTEPAAHLGLFAGDEQRVVAFNGCKCSTANEHVAAEKLRPASRIDPVEIQHPVVDRAARIALPPMSPDGRNLSFVEGVLQLTCRESNKVRIQFGVSIEEENQRTTLPPTSRHSFPALPSAARLSGE